MKPLTADEVAGIERAIGALESRAGVQVVTAIVPRSDDYPEIAWRAFALGASVAALIALVGDVVRPDWMSMRGLLVQAVTILAVAALTGMLTYTLPAFARLFLGKQRARSEVRQLAESLFLTRELFATPERDAVLVFVSEFEHRVVVVPDVFYRGRVTHDEWEGVVARMTPLLRQQRTAEAFGAGLAAIEALLAGKGIAATAKTNVLSDALVRGERP
jgi:putative membrane protein